MTEFCQGDIIKISGFKKKLFVVTSKNAYIRATGMFHICPLSSDVQKGPVRLEVMGKNKTKGVVVCDQVKIIDPVLRSCSRVDRLSYESIMEISDIIQGIFEYD